MQRVVVAEGDDATHVRQEDQLRDGDAVLVLAVEFDAGTAEDLDGTGGGADADEAEGRVPGQRRRFVGKSMLEGLQN